MKHRKGFTLLELVIIIIIVVLIGLMLAPTFTRGHNADIRLANQTNIRAAKAAAERQYLTDGFDGQYSENVKGETKYFNIYMYTTSTDSIDRTSAPKLKDVLELANKARETAADNEVCSYIMVKIGYGDAGKLEVKTAPFYEKNGKVGGNENDPFGVGYSLTD